MRSYLQIIKEQLLIYCRLPGEISRISKHQYCVVTWSTSSTSRKVYTTQGRLQSDCNIRCRKQLKKGAIPNAETTPEEIAQRIANLAVTDNVFVLTIPLCFPTEKQKEKEKRSLSVEELSRHTKAIKHLYNLSLSARWGYRGILQYIYCECQGSDSDKVRLTGKSLRH